MGNISFMHIIIVGVIAWAIFKFVTQGGNAPRMVCKACGHQGGGQSKTRGSFAIEIILWLCFIVPGLIYSIWRAGSRYKACASCGKNELIPANSPIGQKIIAELGEKKS